MIDPEAAQAQLNRFSGFLQEHKKAQIEKKLHLENQYLKQLIWQATQSDLPVTTESSQRSYRDAYASNRSGLEFK